MSGFGGKSKSATNAPIVYSGLNVSTSQLNIPVALFWGMRRLVTNAIDYDGFQKHATSAKGKGGGGKGGQQYDYTADCIIALGEGPIDYIQNVWATGSTTTTTSLSALNMAFFSGTASQAPWSFWATNHPTKAQAYSQTAYLGAPKLDLGASATIPDNAFECVRTMGFSYVHDSDGWINPSSGAVSPGKDCLLSDIIPDFLTNPQYGLGWSSGDIGSITLFAAYQRAQGLFFSPLLNGQTKATDLLDRWAQMANAWIYWSGTQLQFVPLGDSAITGNGVTYTPQVDVAYDLGLADFIPDGEGTPPVKVTRKDPADCYNRTTLSFTDRTRGYISNPAEYKDATLIDQFGQRDNSSIQGDDVCDPAVAAIIVQLIGKRAAYIRNNYAFKTYYRYIRCLPGTVITLTEPNMGLDHVRVRVTEIEEDDQGQLSFSCEEFPGTVGTYVPSLATAATETPSTPNMLSDPGNVNTPAIIELNATAAGGRPKVIVAASGGANWGGCNVHLSFDGTSYARVGTINNAAVQGVLTATLASHVDPDTAGTLSVDCTESLAQQATVAHADADALRTLSLVAAQPMLSGGAYIVPTNGELLAFGHVVATATYAADLSYLRRGQYGTAPAAHGAGDQFTLVDVLGSDGSTISYDLPAGYVGQPLYIKLASFNVFGLATQDLSICAEYAYIPSGIGAPDAGAWAVVPVALGSSGANVPALLISGTAPAYVSGWVVETRTLQGLFNEDGTPILNEDGTPMLAEGSEGPWMADSVQPRLATTRTVSNGIANNGIYEVAISYQLGDQVGARLVLGPVVAGDLSVSRACYTITGLSPSFPVTSDDTHIYVAAFTAVLDDGNAIACPAATIGSLASSTTYGVFWRISTSTYEVDPFPALSRKASSDYVYICFYDTSSGGSYTPPTAPPPGYRGDGVNPLA
ncbi:hypothetical protein BH10PSE14_BH10PSE14_06850 [soil metagenome]